MPNCVRVMCQSLYSFSAGHRGCARSPAGTRSWPHSSHHPWHHTCTSADRWASVQVFSFPMASPQGAITRDDTDALSHLNLCLAYQRHWCEHKTSVTISVKEDEWAPVGDWVYDHFDDLAGACCACCDGHSNLAVYHLLSITCCACCGQECRSAAKRWLHPVPVRLLVAGAMPVQPFGLYVTSA